MIIHNSHSSFCRLRSYVWSCLQSALAVVPTQSFFNTTTYSLLSRLSFFISPWKNRWNIIGEYITNKELDLEYKTSFKANTSSTRGNNVSFVCFLLKRCEFFSQDIHVAWYIASADHNHLDSSDCVRQF